MDALADLVRYSADQDDLKAYLGGYRIGLDGNFPWHDLIQLPHYVLKEAHQLPSDQLEELMEEARRISEMAQDGAHLALHALVDDKQHFESLQSQFDRSRWMLAHEPENFARAEAYFLFTKVQGKVSRCQPYEGVKGLTVDQVKSLENQFVQALRRSLPGGKKIWLETFGHVGTDKSIQITLYKEHLPIKEPAFKGDLLTWRKRVPVFSYIIFYNPETGVYEVVANKSDERKQLAEIFNHCVLNNGKPKPVAHAGYDLSTLKEKRGFTTGDGITSVKVTRLKVSNYTQGMVFTLEPLNKKDCLYQVAARKGDQNPLAGRLRVEKATIAVKFTSKHPGGHPRSVTFEITETSVNLESGLDKPLHRLLKTHYLAVWKLIRQIPAELV